MEHLIDIPGRLHSVAVEKHIAGTDQIYDDFLKTTQDILNLENITDVKVQEGKLQFLNIQGQVLKEISIAFEQKQSDWNQTDSTQVDFIKNRPTVYNKQEVDDKLITKQDIIDDIATIRSGAQAGATAYQKPQTGIPATDLASDTQSDLAAIDSIEAVIPEQASPSNQLADKNFVNSSVATNTANYISDNGQPFQSLEDLETYEGILTNNDYAFVVGADSAGNTTYSRYKYNASTQQWALEYVLNNSSFTAEQWESISSGITNSLVAKLSAMPTNSELTTILNEKVDTTDLNKYVPKTDDDGHGNMSIYGQGNITMTLADEQGVINQTGSFWAGGWYVTSLQGTFQTSGNTIYRGTIGIDQDSVVWEKTATQQIPAATTEANGLMSAEDKKKLDDMKGSSTAADVSYDNSKSGLTAANVQDAIDEMADTNLYETVVLTIGSADSSFNPVGQTITVTLEDGSATQYTVPMSRQITFIVQRGMRYTISGTSTADYRVLPISVKAAIPTRYLTMRYIPIATGVFILQKDGNYYLREEYDAETMAENAVGVLVLTSGLISNKHGIVISKNSALKKFSQSTHSGARGYQEQSYNGYTTTQTMTSKGDSLASYCWGLSIQMDNGILQGFLPAQIEGKQVSTNMKEVNDCLKVIGGKILSSGDDYMTVNWYGNQCCGWVAMNSVNNRSNCCPVYYYPLL